MLNIKAKEVAPFVEQPADISEEWPEDVVEEPGPDLSEPSKKKSDHHEDHRVGLSA